MKKLAAILRSDFVYAAFTSRLLVAAVRWAVFLQILLSAPLQNADNKVDVAMNEPSTSPRTMITLHVPTGVWNPNGYEGIRDAVRRICDALEGVRRPYSEPTFLDEVLWASAVAAIWQAVDRGDLSVLIFGRAGEVSEVPADVTRAVPYFRKPHVLSLVYLRSMHPLHQQFAARFGSDFTHLPIGFQMSEIEKLERKIRRANSGKDTLRRGRPPIPHVSDTIKSLVDEGRWDTSQSLKALTGEVSRKLKQNVSDDTAGRALGRIFEETGDHRYKRFRRKLK